MPDCDPDAFQKPAEAVDDTFDLPVVTEHAAQRWDERTPADSVAPETAWKQAEPDDVLDSSIAAYIETHSECAEARYHSPTGTALLRVGFRIVTVLPRDDPRIRTALEHVHPDSDTEVAG